MQGEDWSPFVVTDSKIVTGQNPQVVPLTPPAISASWLQRYLNVTFYMWRLSLQLQMLTGIHHLSSYETRISMRGLCMS